MEKAAAGPIDTPEFQADLNDQSWKQESNEDGIKTFSKKIQSSEVIAFRGEALIPASIAKIATVLSQDNLRKEWVDALAESFAVQKISKTERIEYNHSKVPWPLQDRDFVFHVNVYFKKKPKSILITLKSVPDERMPPKENIVRGEIVHAWYYLTEMEGVRATRVMVEMALDLKGSVPLWFVNLVQKSWPYKTLQKLKKVSNREDIVPSGEIREYFTDEEKVK